MRPRKILSGENFLVRGPETVNQLIDHVATLEALGDGRTVTVDHTPGGQVIKLLPSGLAAASLFRGGGSSAAVYDGPFALTFKDGKLFVAAGWLLRNGEMLTVAEVKDMTPPKSTGVLCVCSTVENKKWTVPEIKIATPAADAWPIAEIKIDAKGKLTIRQFFSPVAVIMLKKTCAFTRPANG